MKMDPEESLTIARAICEQNDQKAVMFFAMDENGKITMGTAAIETEDMDRLVAGVQHIVPQLSNDIEEVRQNHARRN